MINRRSVPTVLATFLTSSFAGAAPVADSPRVFDVHYGLASFATRQIYQEAASVSYQENGRCTMGSADQPCLQWGFRFRFSGVEPGARMQCSSAVTLTTRLLALGPPSSTRTDYAWVFTFPRREGMAFVPQFLTRTPGEKSTRDIDMKCRLGDQDVIAFRFSVATGE